MPLRFGRTLKVLGLILCLSLGITVSSPSMTLDEEKAIGDELFKRLSRELEFVQDPVINLYVREVGQRVVEASGDKRFSYRFLVIEGNQPNAFTIPGGYVFVNTALLNLCSSEDELAGVLAHEVAHSALRHVSRMFEQARKVSVASLAMMVAGLLLAKDTEAQKAIVAGASGLAQSLMLKYQRDHEAEADQFALQVIKRAGYSPQGMIAFMRKMLRWSRTVSVEAPTYLSTHPALSERAAYLQSLADPTPPEETLAFRRIKARLALMQRGPDAIIAEEGPAGSGDPDQRYLLALAFLQKGDHRRAREILEAMPDDPYAKRELALLAFQVRDFRKAESLIDEALSSFPGDPELIMAKVNLLLDQGRLEEAMGFCQRAMGDIPDEPFLHRVLGELLLKAGREAEAYEQFGLYSLKEGDRQAALHHFRRALELAQGEVRERIEGRIKALEGP